MSGIRVPGNDADAFLESLYPSYSPCDNFFVDPLIPRWPDSVRHSSKLCYSYQTINHIVSGLAFTSSRMLNKVAEHYTLCVSAATFKHATRLESTP